jgi:micrococcal nuclease
MKWLVGLLLLTNLITGYLFLKKDSIKTYTVVRVIDGDTLVIDNNQEIRLANVNAPEAGLCGFEEAKKTMEEMATNKKIKIEGKVNDKYGRLLVSVWINSELLNEKIMKTGWVRYISQGDNKWLKGVDDQSQKDKLGIYGMCIETTNITNPKCLIKGNNREGKKIYILPGCKGYTNTDIEKDLGDEWFCKSEDAERAGYIKALNCN